MDCVLLAAGAARATCSGSLLTHAVHHPLAVPGLLATQAQFNLSGFSHGKFASRKSMHQAARRVLTAER